jgi:hypothetical protein
VVIIGEGGCGVLLCRYGGSGCKDSGDGGRTLSQRKYLLVQYKEIEKKMYLGLETRLEPHWLLLLLVDLGGGHASTSPAAVSVAVDTFIWTRRIGGRHLEDLF